MHTHQHSDTPARNIDTLRKVYGRQVQLHKDAARLRGKSRGQTQLHDELDMRLHSADVILAEGEADLAYEVLYGIGLGLDGMASRWGTHNQSAGDSQDD